MKRAFAILGTIILIGIIIIILLKDVYIGNIKIVILELILM